MKIERIDEPVYRLTLNAEEMAKLWSLCEKAHHDHRLENSYYFYNLLEDARPAGGFNNK